MATAEFSILAVREMQVKDGHRSGWTSSIELQTINAGEAVEKGNPLALLV